MEKQKHLRGLGKAASQAQGAKGSKLAVRTGTLIPPDGLRLPQDEARHQSVGLIDVLLHFGKRQENDLE